jgi:undecaprenyl-phosphate galactose phosphotransferase/putative colanic acid biosynthesis UDP-glucose lipid carrier transferase
MARAKVGSYGQENDSLIVTRIEAAKGNRAEGAISYVAANARLGQYDPVTVMEGGSPTTVIIERRQGNLTKPIFTDDTVPLMHCRSAASTSARALAVESTLKRTLDIGLALVAIVLLAPLLVIAAIAIKLDSAGPVIFRQRRNGLNGIPFVIFKFRTMTVLEDGPAFTQAQRGDRRVTRVGRLLRRSSIDELPQLFNVLKGDMALVGPRPHPLALDNHYKGLIATYSYRFHVKPGITGWAQINGLRGETSRPEQMDERITHDLWYINHWSLRLDIYILLRTCLEVLLIRAY